MTEPFVGEIQTLSFGFAPRGYAIAAGQLLPVQQNVALYSLLGVTFGGDGVTSFALPNLASRHACGTGQSPGNTQRTQGQAFGSFSVALSSMQMPAHTHGLSAYRPNSPTALSAIPASSSAIGHSGFGTFDAFAPFGTAVDFSSSAVTTEGNGSAHDNAQPYLGLTYAIALQGIYPSRP